MSVLARFSRTLGTLMESGVPVLQALSIVKETLNNEVVIKAVTDIHDNVKEGETMAAPIEGNKIFPPIFTSMVEVGEETGELPAMLLKVADMYEDEVDNTVAALSSIIEPLLIVLLAIVVGTIVIALFLPMVSIIGNLS
jgi:type IV pilus assembly protein PilC